MIGSGDIQQVVGADAYGSDGSKIGSIGQVFLDDETGEPVFATVLTGLFGMAETFVPLANASFSGGRVDVGFDRETVKSAPSVSPDDGHLNPEEEQMLYDYYGLTYAPNPDDSGSPVEDETYQDPYTTSVRSEIPTVRQPSDRADTAMTRSEEQLNVGKERQLTGKARLRKYVVTENVTMTVPVRREKAVLESVPVGEEGTTVENEIVEGTAVISEGQPEIILHEEVPVVETVVQPVERVRLGKEAYTVEETVTEDVRREEIAVEGDIVDRDETSGTT